MCHLKILFFRILVNWERWINPHKIDYDGLTLIESIMMDWPT